MSKNITKRQHYVWRKYLRAWSNNDSIYAYIKQQNDIKYTDLMTVAQERYFYRFHSFTELEKKFLIGMCNVDGPIKPMLDDLIFDMNLYNGIKDLQKKISPTIPEPLNELEKNGFEKFHGIIEAYGYKIIACKKKEDLYFFDDFQSKFETLTYLCFQYFRTKKQRDAQIESFKNESLDIKSIYSVLVIIISLRVAQNISFDLKIRYTLLEISSDNEISFITGDQPVINLLADDLNQNGEVQSLMFYYPISPKYAIKIDFTGIGDVYQHQFLTVQEVNELNKKMISEYNEFIFSDSLRQLETYQQNIEAVIAKEC